jgi:AcrR family transcriptional regulator
VAEEGSERSVAILEATCRVIGRVGIHRFRIEDIAGEAGVSTGLVYYYYESRDNLVRTALQFADARSSVAPAGTTSGGSGLDRLYQTLLLELDDRPASREAWVMWNEVSSEAVFDPQALSALKRLSGEWVTTLVGLIEEGQADGSIPDELLPLDVAERLIGIADGLGTKWFLGIMPRQRAHELLVQSMGAELGVAPNANRGTNGSGTAPHRH